MERAVFVYTTWPTAVEAEEAGRKLVERCHTVVHRLNRFWVVAD